MTNPYYLLQTDTPEPEEHTPCPLEVLKRLQDKMGLMPHDLAIPQDLITPGNGTIVQEELIQELFRKEFHRFQYEVREYA